MKIRKLSFYFKKCSEGKKKGKKTKFQKITYASGLIKGFTYHSHHLSGNSTSCSRTKKNQNENWNSCYTSDKKWTRLFCLKFQLYKYPYVTCDFIEEYVNKIIRWWAFLHAYYDLFPNLDSSRFRFLTHDTGLLEKNHTTENIPRRRSLKTGFCGCNNVQTKMKVYGTDTVKQLKFSSIAICIGTDRRGQTILMLCPFGRLTPSLNEGSALSPWFNAISKAE